MGWPLPLPGQGAGYPAGNAVPAGATAGATETEASEHRSDNGASRRTVIAGTGVAVVAGAAGFASYAIAKPPVKADVAAGYPPPAAGGTPTALSTVAAIPENGGVVLTDQAIVLTRESGDTVHGFSAVCTHQGCLVSNVANGVITCPCHGSTFDAATGSVVGGPAPTGLPAVPVKVTDGSVFRG